MPVIPTLLNATESGFLSSFQWRRHLWSSRTVLSFSAVSFWWSFSSIKNSFLTCMTDGCWWVWFLAKLWHYLFISIRWVNSSSKAHRTNPYLYTIKKVIIYKSRTFLLQWLAVYNV